MQTENSGTDMHHVARKEAAIVLKAFDGRIGSHKAVNHVLPGAEQLDKRVGFVGTELPGENTGALSNDSGVCSSIMARTK